MAQVTTAERKSIFSLFNFIALIIVGVGIYLSYLRFTGGLAAVTNLSDYHPWGLWISFDLLCGVALAAGGYVTSSAVYLFGMKKYHSAVRPAILTAFLGYFLVFIAINFDVGRPWRLPYPLIVQQGTTSVLFEVGLCVATYLTILFIEFSPAPMDWLGLRKARDLVVKLTILLTIFGVILSTMHQSSLGSLFLIVPSKLHPLWYSPYIPIYFFISSIIAGLSMVIFESTLSHACFGHKMDQTHLEEAGSVTLGFGKAAAYTLAGYFAIKVMGISADDNWHYLSTRYGTWYLLELLGFVALPCLLYALGVRAKSLTLIRWTSVLAVLGVVLNRLNVCLIAFNWHLPPSDRYFPHWMEIGISIFIVMIGLLLYRFIVTRMPILYEHPDYQESH